MANNDWILDVLADLKSFASANDLRPLAKELEQTLSVAASVLSTSGYGGCDREHGKQAEAGQRFREARGHPNS